MAGYITAKALSIANDAVPDDNDVLPVMTATSPPLPHVINNDISENSFIHSLLDYNAIWRR